MTPKEILELIEEVLGLKPGSITADTEMSALREWDSLTMLSLQIRLSAVNPDLQFDQLFACETAGDICGLM